MSHSGNKVRVGISVGDLNGVGMEVIIKSLMDQRVLQLFTPIIYGSEKSANQHKETLDAKEFSFYFVKSAKDAKPKKVNLVNSWSDEPQLSIGKPSSQVGDYALKSLEAATADLADGLIDVLVTAPIDKKTIQSPEFNFPGHTEYLAQLSNVKEALMLLVSNNLRVGVVTGHIPLKDVASTLNQDLIIDKTTQLNNSLIKDFGIRRPRIAILGLNPHAGDEGVIGEEDSKIIAPAIAKAKEEGILAFGPYPADGFFGSSTFQKFDGVLAMYHDQGLAPFKALSFGTGVNYTAGLPIVRTSPDHGTAYDIAGQNKANEDSFRNALFQAVDIFRKRQEYREIHANPLQAQKKTPNKRT